MSAPQYSAAAIRNILFEGVLPRLKQILNQMPYWKPQYLIYKSTPEHHINIKYSNLIHFEVSLDSYHNISQPGYNLVVTIEKKIWEPHNNQYHTLNSERFLFTSRSRTSFVDDIAKFVFHHCLVDGKTSPHIGNHLVWQALDKILNVLDQ
jgi:hypothetical protein